jgi:hypothetical protein
MMKILTTILIFIAFINLTLKNTEPIRAATTQYNNCTRSTPIPIVKRSIFPNTKFVLRKIDNYGQDNPKGIETVIFNNGDRLDITNSGCEMFALNFRFETSQIDAKKMKDKKYLYNRSAWLMGQILPGIKASLDLKGGITALKNYAAKQISPEIGKEIDYGDPEIRSVVKLSEIKQLPNNKVAVAILFYYGPL